MYPPLRPCLCVHLSLFLLATCSARPNWHKGVVVVKDLPAPHAFAHPEYSEAEIAAAQVMRNAEEEAQMHMATMQQKYMDEVRQHFYNSFAHYPFGKKRLDGFKSNQHSEVVLPIASVPPQPVFIHRTAGNPCSGHILNCLHTNLPPRIGKIVPSPSVGLQPCFGPNCNHIVFSPQFIPAVIPKPMHSSNSNKNPSKRPHKHHHICDRKRPDQDCHHRSTFWPTYATVKLHTKLYIPTATNSQKEIHHPSSLPLPSSSVPSNVFNTQTTPPSVQPINKFNIETLRSNASKLENEILGIPDHVTQNSKIPSDVPSKQSTNFIPPNLKTTELIPELKEVTENIASLKVHTNFTDPTFSFDNNDVTESSKLDITELAQTSYNSLDFEKKLTTSREIFQTITESNGEEQKLVTETTTVYEGNHGRTTIINTVDSRMGGNEMESSTSLQEDKQLELKATTADQDPEFKSEMELMTTVKSLTRDSSSTLDDINTDYDNQETTTATEDEISRSPSLKTNKEENQQIPATTTMNYNEYNTRMFDSDLAETTLREDLKSSETLFVDPQEQKEFPLQTTPNIVHNPTEYFLEYSTYVGREDVDAVGSEITGNSDIDSINTFENTTPSTEPKDSDNHNIIEETTTEPVSDLSAESRNNVFSTTESSNTLSPSSNIGNKINQESREETITDSVTTASSSDKLEVSQQTPSKLDEIKDLLTLIQDRNIEVTESMAAEDSMEQVSDFPPGPRDYLLSATGIDLQNNFETEDNQEAKEETFTNSNQRFSDSTMHLEELQSVQNEREDTLALPTQLPNGDTREIQSTTEDFVDNLRTTLSVDLMNNEISTQTNYINLPPSLGRENVYETATIQESSSDSKIIQSDLITSEDIITPNHASKELETESSYFQGTTESKESKINWEEETDWATEKAGTTDYFPQAREDLSHDNDLTKYNLEEDTTSQKPAEEPASNTWSSFTKTYTQTDYENVQQETTTTLLAKSIDETIDTTTLQSNIEDSLNKSDPRENQETINTTDSDKEVIQLAEENENPGTISSYIPIDSKEDTTTENSHQLPQSREDDEGNTYVLLEITSEMSPERYTTDDQEEKTSSVTITANRNDNVMQTTETEVTESHELRENIYDSTTVRDYTETETVTVHFESEIKKEVTEDEKDETEYKPYESNLIIPEELIGKTDSPGLIINYDFTEEHTEDTSLDTLTDFTASAKGASFEYPHSKSNVDKYSLEAVPHLSSTEVPNTDGAGSAESTNFKLDEPTTTVTLLNEEMSHTSYQSGVLKFTSEIETATRDAVFTELSEGSTDTHVDLALNDISNRKSRSVKHTENKIESYPTTECMFCLLRLPHGHRIKRSLENSNVSIASENENSDSETSILESGKSNCSLPANINLEDSESSSFYASTILELLPVIREGYKNNAFSEEDKKVIRSIFGDMKELLDEDTFETITESTGGFMGDGATRIDEIIEDTEYDSSEYELSEKERLKRSKKNLKMMNDLLKKVPSNLKNHPAIPSQLKHSRVTRSTHVTQAEASAILALLAEKGEAVQLDIADDEDDDEYEYYEDEGDEYRDEDSYADAYEDDYNNPSFGELIKLARKHKERKARAGES